MGHDSCKCLLLVEIGARISMLRKFAQEVQFHVNNIDFQLHNELTSLKVYLALVPKNVLTLGMVICELFVIDLSKVDSL
jgi:hypothetical protein